MVIAIFSGFVLAIMAPSLYRVGRGATGWLLALLPFLLFLYFLSAAPSVAAGERLATTYPWAPTLGVNLSFSIDGLGLLFALLINGIGGLVLIYAGTYLAGNPQLGRFYAFLLFFMASMLGLVLADNILLLFVFWELTSISSFLLIGFSHEKAAARTAAIQALLVTGGGGLALLGGMILLGLAGGSFELSDLLARGAMVQSDGRYLPLLLLILIGAFTKSAQFPFHFWLPGAMEAPTPVSAYLHSATMVKAGIYLLARLSPVLGNTTEWTGIVTTVGVATMLVGGFVALYQTDLKRILAYSTISALGMLVMLLGLGTEAAVTAAVVFLLAHALYKGALFMIAGTLEHETGTRDVERLGGLRRAMPLTTLIAGLAALSLAGFGPLLSFIGKELALEAVLAVHQVRSVIVPLVVLASAAFVTVGAIVGIRPFFGVLKPTPQSAHEAPFSLSLGPGLLAVLGLIFGIAPGVVEMYLVVPAASTILGQPQTIDLYLWHGINPALLLTLLSVGLGIALYAGWGMLRRSTSRVESLFRWGPESWYRTGVRGIDRLARAITHRLQSGQLRNYLLITMVATVGLVGGTLLNRGAARMLPLSADIRLHEVGIAVIILLGAVATIFGRSRLSAVATLSVVGSGIGVFYVLYSAPDLAMTQVLVETLSVLLFVFVFFHLPSFRVRSSRMERARDAVISLALGGLMTLLVLAAAVTTPNSQLAAYYGENSKALAHGSNIVNVILVDFRGLDTLGEITVLSVAAIGVFALLKLRPRKGGSR